jgi:UDP-2,3-diacylglucosamine hydrolase
MKHALFVSDLHLSAERPAIGRQFLAFAAGPARAAEALYILGDLFEYWIGDDDDDALAAAVAGALGALARGGTAVHLMHGNRDLLIGRAYAERCGATLLDDPLLVDLYGTPTLLTHGDALCTADVDYQRFRAYARDPANQARFLAQPLAERHRQMLDLRHQSQQSQKEKTNEIMDVSEDAVVETLRRHGYPRLIHGHTHRPARHLHVVDGRRCERWVLGDWYANGSYLRCDAGGCRAHALAPA